MSFTWNELVCHGLLKEIGERGVVLQVLMFVKPMRRQFQEEEARQFYQAIAEKVGPLADPGRSRRACAGWHWETSRAATRMRYYVEPELRKLWNMRSPERRRSFLGSRRGGAHRPEIPNTRKWYENIHEGRYFLWADPEIDHWCGLLISDIKTIDGPGLGEPPGDEVKHIDDMFS
tara:strand:- start:371 stop:895 length:525 start_codon:yes stop_codon:yes gene_type:complete